MAPVLSLARPVKTSESQTIVMVLVLPAGGLHREGWMNGRLAEQPEV